MSAMSFAGFDQKKRARQSMEDKLIDLQQQTLAAVTRLADLQQEQVAIQHQLLEIK